MIGDMELPKPERPIPGPEDDGEPTDDQEGVLRVLDTSGDRRVKWKRGDAKSIERAKAKFEDLKKRGYAFFALKRVTKFRDSNGTELVASKSADALRAPVQDSPEGPVRRFEPDEHREVVAGPPRRGG